MKCAWWFLILAGTLGLWVEAQDLLDDLKPQRRQPDKPPIEDLDDLLDNKFRGTPLRLVPIDAPAKSLADRLYWREVEGVVAASTAPPEIRLGGETVIAPQLEENDGGPPREHYPTEGAAKLTEGRHRLTPGDIELLVKGGTPSCDHPAVQIVPGKLSPEIRIRCAPVALRVVDQQGAPVPTTIRLESGGRSVLRKPGPFAALIAWLPVGVKYDSTLGSFEIDRDGKLVPLRLAAEVTAAAGELRRVVRSAPRVSAIEASDVVTLSLGEDRPDEVLKVFVPPQIAWRAPLRVAVSKAQLARLQAGPLQPDTWTAHVLYNSVSGMDSPPARFAPSAPAEAWVDRAQTALRIAANDLLWLETELPPALYGPTALELRTPLTRPGRVSLFVGQLGRGLYLVPHRWRTDFAHGEQAVYQLFASPDAAGRAAQLSVEPVAAPAAGAARQPLGSVQLPPAGDDGFAATVFTVQTADLPAGEYWLRATSADGTAQAAVVLRVFSSVRRSPFFVHSMSGCTQCWPTSEEGLQLFEDAGLEMVTATGATSLLDVQLPTADPQLAARLNQAGFTVPVELATRPAGNDYLLARLQRHRLALIDLAVVRSAGMYLEGLSYHHSYPPTVDRMIRRMQIFAQHTADYAAWSGVNYAWFPQLFGYAEGGVPTDAHVGDRNQALLARVAEAGFQAMTPEERQFYDRHKFSADPNLRQKALALMQRHVAWWRAVQDFGWGQHNKLYNDALRQVRPNVVCTLFDNAGHDEGKRTRSLFGDMDASCYESYTDFGDWPISSAFVVDWARANHSEKPVWLTTCWGASSEGMMKSLLHAAIRGMQGGGVPLQETFDLDELRRRVSGMKLLGQYGALAEHGQPDARVAILSRAATQALTPRGMWRYHALYAHLTCLGFPPVLLRDSTVLDEGVPASVRIVLLADEQEPLEPKVEAALKKFQTAGGLVVLVGESPISLAGAIVVRQPLKHLWQLEGFQPGSHAALWREFQAVWRQPLEALLSEHGLQPLASTDPLRGLALGMTAGPVRFVAVIADAADTHSNEFVRTAALPVSLEGTGWCVRDLVKQQDLATKTVGRRTVVQVDLLTEPTTLLALYPAPPAQIAVEVRGRPQLGGRLSVRALVTDTQGDGLGPVPVAYTIRDPAGNQSGPFHRAAGDEAHFPLPRLATAGGWQVEVQELLTGLTATAEVEVTVPDGAVQTVRQSGPVHIVQEEHLRQFAAKSGEKVIIVEPGQTELLPLAEQLRRDLQQSGIEARLWPVQPEDFDTLAVRWYPEPEDMARLSLIETGRLIGYRQNLQPYIDKVTRTHVPQRGGYAEIAPPYMLGQDAIVFSGGRLAESLRAVTTWMETPNAPSAGQGRLVVCFSPFAARRDVAAVVGNDLEGLSRAAETLARRMRQFREAAPPETSPLAEAEPWRPCSAAQAQRPVPQPYGNFSPIRRVQQLLATGAGRSVLLLDGEADNLALVNDQGKVTATVRLPEDTSEPLQIDQQGRAVVLRREVLARHPGWNFPTEIAQRLLRIGTEGRQEYDVPAFRGPTAHLPADYLSAILIDAQGEPALLGRRGGLWSRTAAGAWRWYDDLPFARHRFEVLFPRVPVGAALSPDGRYAFVCFESRPALGAFSNPPPTPTAVEAVLLDMQTGQKRWSRRADRFQDSAYSVHRGFAAVARDAAVTALADYQGTCYLIDGGGKTILEHPAAGGPMQQRDPLGPPQGVGVWLTDDGRLAVFAFRDKLLLAEDGQVREVPLAGVADAAVSPDGTTVFAALGSGRVLALDPQGRQRWSRQVGTTAAWVAAIADGHLLIANGDGHLLRVDEQGKDVWQTNVAEAADAGIHSLEPSSSPATPELPREYREPGTLDFARRHLAGRALTAWKPAGPGRPLFDRAFHPVQERLELKAAVDGGEALVHLVYRRVDEAEPPPRLTITGGDGTETFVLDLPTPEYRVVNLPIRGKAVSVALLPGGPMEVAEFALWQFRWPGANLAYIRPAAENLVVGKTPPVKSAADDLLEELGERRPAASGRLKTCQIWWPNADPDTVAGPWLPVPIDPAQLVDSKRFVGGKMAPFSDRKGSFGPTRGGFLTIDFGQPQALGLVAVYDRAVKQSDVCRNLVVFESSEEEVDALTTGRVLAGTIDNDQFWRLFPFSPVKVQQLGVHVFHSTDQPEGLSEVEAYAAPASLQEDQP